MTFKVETKSDVKIEHFYIGIEMFEFTLNNSLFLNNFFIVASNFSFEFSKLIKVEVQSGSIFLEDVNFVKYSD